jgi:hypothetical protein
MNTSIESQIQQAISEVKSGNKDAARKILSKVVVQEPNNARAWYLLSQVVDKPERAIYCLERVLKFEPNNVQAKGRLQNLITSLPKISLPTRNESLEEEKWGQEINHYKHNFDLSASMQENYSKKDNKKTKAQSEPEVQQLTNQPQPASNLGKSEDNKSNDRKWLLILGITAGFLIIVIINTFAKIEIKGIGPL